LVPLESEIVGKERKLELAFAGLVALTLVALTFAVTKFAATQDPVADFSATPEPIVVFPDFASISDIDEKKQRFFDFLQDYVRYENSLVSDLRRRLLSYAEIVGDGVPLSGYEREWVVELAVTYGVEAETANDQALVKELLLSVDVIPASLVLAPDRSLSQLLLHR
jgi:uncharacterized FlgJ-related protein